MYFSDHMQWYCKEFLSSSTSGPPLEQSSCAVVDLIPKTNSAFSGTTPMLHRETNHAISQTINAVRLMKAPWSHFRQPLTVTSHPCLPVTHTHTPILLQARCPSCHPTNSVKALKAMLACQWCLNGIWTAGRLCALSQTVTLQLHSRASPLPCAQKATCSEHSVLHLTQSLVTNSHQYCLFLKMSAFQLIGCESSVCKHSRMTWQQYTSLN